jgi:hypothetical protein
MMASVRSKSACTALRPQAATTILHHHESRPEGYLKIKRFSMQMTSKELQLLAFV